MNTGTVIFLNGTSSAGKTTLAQALQEQFEEPWQHMALDQYRDGLPARYRGLNSPDGTSGQRGLNVVTVQPGDGEAFTQVRFGEDGRKMLRGMRRGIAAMATAGMNVLIDDIILEPEFLQDYLSVMNGIRLYFVGVHCPPEVIATREAARPGRFPGTAVGHFGVCHAHRHYDVEIDTSAESPESCADRVIARVNAGPPEAFDQLRREGFTG